jgi:uncharacterized membrane protein
VSDQATAQQNAERIRLLREELASGELKSVLDLTPLQQERFDEWSRTRLAALAEQFDVDTTTSQKRVSWGMRIASTLGGFAICTAVILLFLRYWGFLETWLQVIIVMAVPLLALAGAECAARRERTHYFTGLLSLVALASFVMNLVVIGDIFNIAPTERALLPWGGFALVLAYRYRLRLMLTLGLLFLVSYAAAFFTSAIGYQWLDFGQRPEHFIPLGLLVFAVPFYFKHPGQSNFLPVYRLTGALVILMAVLSLADWGFPSYLSWDPKTVERLYEFIGLILSAGAIWLGIVRNWSGIVNAGACFFTIFLFTRLYRWWWDWLPKYLFFAMIGALGIGLVLAFRLLRNRLVAA